MTLTIADQSIEYVQIIDDNSSARDAYKFNVEDLKLIPVLVDGPLLSIDQFIKSIRVGHNAAICDYHLKKRSYAAFNGAEMVAKLYQAKIPSVLYTRYADVIDEIRPYRRCIPILLNSDELDPESLESGFERCIEEFNDKYQSSRRPWRTLVRVEDVDEERSMFYVVVPAWDPNKVIRLPLEILPSEVRDRIGKQKRFHAKVNIGAERHEELYFEDWEID